MRMAIFHSRFEEIGGAEVLAVLQAQYLRGQGDHIDLACWSFDESQWGEACTGLGITLVKRRAWHDALWRWSPRVHMRHRAERLGRGLGTLRPEVVLVHNAPSHALLGHSRLEVPKVWYCHEPPRGLYPEAVSPRLSQAIARGELKQPSPGLLAMVEKWGKGRKIDPKQHARRVLDQQGVQGLDRIIANSAYSRANAEAIYGRRDIKVVHPMVCFEDMPRRASGLDRSGLKVLVQTRMEAIKNVDTVLRGFAEVRSRLGSGAMLHVVGAGGELPYLRHLAQELGLQTCTHFHGFLPRRELVALKASCDVFALLPWDEPFGMVYPESAAAGLLLVGSDHGGPLEILEDGRYGWNLPAQAPEALGEALERIWSLPDAEVDRRRIAADRACRDRYAPSIVGAEMRGWLRYA